MQFFPWLSFAQQPRTNVLAVTPVSVIDSAQTRVRTDVTVLIASGKIQPILAAKIARVPPGLWDMHVHTTNAKREFPMFLANGVLGVRHVHGRMERVFEWRKQLAAGTWLGPQLMLAGALLDGPAAATSRSAIIVRNAAEAK